MRTGKELDPVHIAKHNKWECVRVFPMTELDQVMTAAKLLNPALYTCTRTRTRTRTRTSAA
jgi:hypothetical protein